MGVVSWEPGHRACEVQPALPKWSLPFMANSQCLRHKQDCLICWRNRKELPSVQAMPAPLLFTAHPLFLEGLA